VRDKKKSEKKERRLQKTNGKLSRRAAITVLGAGLISTGLQRAAKAMPDPTPTPKGKTLGFNSFGVEVESGGVINVKPEGKHLDKKQFFLKLTCKDGKVKAVCSDDGTF
jgi:hypothetical protein